MSYFMQVYGRKKNQNAQQKTNVFKSISYLFSPKYLKNLMARIKLQYLTFAMMMVLSIGPIIGFYKWVEQSSYNKEIAYVDENHLIIAKNLSAALSRYVTDMKSFFALAVNGGNHLDVSHNLQVALANFNLCYISILNGNNEIVSRIEGDNSHKRDMPSKEALENIRQTAIAANGKIAVTGILNHLGSPHLFVVQALPSGDLAFAPWSPDYIAKLQKSIAFGERGHSMVVDHDGRVIAHPNAKWQAISKDASKLSVVQAMITQNTGVMQFYSPPMQADMIAGYTFVPETGWGVMVPQPISELADRAKDVESAAMIIALVGISLVGLLSWWFSTLLSRPFSAIVGSAEAVASGDFDTRVDKLPVITPVEIKLMAAAFNKMVDELKEKTYRLQQAVVNAEEISQERAELLKKANEANVMKSQFVSIVSHELRTPLTSIKGSLDLLNSECLGTLPTKSKKLVEISVKNCSRLSILINDLLDIGMLDDGTMRYDMGKQNLASLLTETVEASQSYGDLHGVTYKLSGTDQQSFVKGDRSRLIQVMLNLLSNAAKFSKPDSNVEVELIIGKSNARVLVTDHGVGIPENARKRVFGKFSQVDASNQRSIGGSGLGLFISKMITEKHKGTLSYTSEVNVGTTFEMTLPLYSV